MLAGTLAYFQYLLPRYWLTSLVYRIARIRHPGVKDFLIRRFIKLFAVDTDAGEVKLDIPDGFATFNEFFVRELVDGARPIDADSATVIAPVDGTVSQAGRLRDGVILQAKGRKYTVEDLLATDLDEARTYANGAFATLYLAPYNYHRVHAPLAGDIVAARYVPGDLFSVNAATAATIPGLFRRNERLILRFRAAHGPFLVILVGALNVGSISTRWSGEMRPRKKGVVETMDLQRGPTSVEKGDLLGWFNMGSTVIVLLPDGVCDWLEGLRPGARVCMGRPIGRLSGNGA